MAFGRRKSGNRNRGGKGRDPFEHLADERRAAEGDAWFMQPDEGPVLDVQTGVSSNLSQDDLGRSEPAAEEPAGVDDPDADLDLR